MEFHPDNPESWPEPETEEPDEGTLEQWILDGVAEATDGCMVELDGWCEHDHVSWVLYLDLI